MKFELIYKEKKLNKENEEKLKKDLNRFENLLGKNIKCTVVLSKNEKCTIEVFLKAGKRSFHAKASALTYSEAEKKVYLKLRQQIVKAKEKKLHEKRTSCLRLELKKNEYDSFEELLDIVG